MRSLLFPPSIVASFILVQMVSRDPYRIRCLCPGVGARQYQAILMSLRLSTLGRYALAVIYHASPFPQRSDQRRRCCFKLTCMVRPCANQDSPDMLTLVLTLSVTPTVAASVVTSLFLFSTHTVEPVQMKLDQFVKA
jgi:hypothetical protein